MACCWMWRRATGIGCLQQSPETPGPVLTDGCRDGHWALVTMVNERSCHLVSAKRIAAGAFVPRLPSENQSLCLVRTEIQGNQQARAQTDRKTKRRIAVNSESC